MDEIPRASDQMVISNKKYSQKLQSDFTNMPVNMGRKKNSKGQSWKWKIPPQIYGKFTMNLMKLL